MIFNKDGTLEGKPKCVLLSDVEKDTCTSLTLYAHAITRGGAKVTITPSPTPVVWLPHAPAVGGEGSAGVANVLATATAADPWILAAGSREASGGLCFPTLCISPEASSSQA